MKVPFVDLKAQYQQLKMEVQHEINQILKETRFIQGPSVCEFERNFAKYIGVRFGIGLNSGTSAVQLAVQSLIRPGDEVITTANTFIATAEAITAAGGRVVFVDIDEKTFTIDPEKIIEAITPKTKMIVPVHLYGHPADMDSIMDIAREYHLFVVEDAAQSHGAEYKGRKTGSIGHAAAFSFYPAKNLGAFGEAGMVTTSSEKVAQFVRLFRNHGSQSKYSHIIEGHNMRMEELQGAVLNVKLKYLDKWNEARRLNAKIYNRLLEGLDGVILPEEAENVKHVYHLYVIRARKREKLSQFLSEKEIESGFHYKFPLHLQKAYKYLGYKAGDLPVTEKVMGEVISLPMFPELTRDQIEYVAQSIKEFYKYN